MAFILQILFGAIITAVKLSILFFYHSIFFINNNFTRILWISGVACVAWLLATTMAFVFQCKPVEAFWSRLAVPDQCVSFTKVLLGYEMTNLILDILILCLPVAMVKGLHLARARKISVAAIFLLGGL